MAASESPSLVAGAGGTIAFGRAALLGPAVVFAEAAAAGAGALATAGVTGGNAAGLTVDPVDLDLVFDMRLRRQVGNRVSAVNAPTQKVLPAPHS